MTRFGGYGVMRRVLFVLALLVLAAGQAGATSIERVVSPGGIEAWLVRRRQRGSHAAKPAGA